MTDHPAAAPTHCPNCGAAVQHVFCAVCGQENRLHVPSVREFFHEFIGHYVALEGKLWRTLALLVFRPGRLTADYLAGRRARYVQPLRVYLTLSILFFALLKYGPQPRVNYDDDTPKRHKEAPAETHPPKPGSISLSSKLGEFSPALAAKLLQINAMPEGEATKLIKSVAFSYVPYAMFLLMPLFALYLKLLYLGSGRRYGEHMLFALHSNAFAYLLLGALSLAPWKSLSDVLMLWLVAYLPLAMRRVYGGSRKAAWMRMLVLMGAWTTSMVAAILGVVAAGLMIAS